MLPGIAGSWYNLGEDQPERSYSVIATSMVGSGGGSTAITRAHEVDCIEHRCRYMYPGCGCVWVQRRGLHVAYLIPGYISG